MKNITQQKIFGIVCGALFISLFSSCKFQDNNFPLIEISTSGCFGSCPILDAKYEEGKVYFNLILHNDSYGVFMHELDVIEKEKLIDLIKSIDLNNIQDTYTSAREDMSKFNVFIKNEKGEKRVYYYSGDAPEELENLSDFLIQLSKKNISKINNPFSISTRMGMEVLKISPPPFPPSDNSSADKN